MNNDLIEITEINNAIDITSHSIAANELMKQKIGKSGFSIVNFKPSNSPDSIHAFPYSYTVGLHEQYKHPELLIFGLNPELSSNILTDLVDILEKNNKITADDLQGICQSPLVLKNIFINDAACYAQLAFFHYKDNNSMPTFQVVYWPDANSKFPWDGDFDPQFKEFQPLFTQKNSV